MQSSRSYFGICGFFPNNIYFFPNFTITVKVLHLTVYSFHRFVEEQLSLNQAYELPNVMLNIKFNSEMCKIKIALTC